MNLKNMEIDYNNCYYLSTIMIYKNCSSIIILHTILHIFYIKIKPILRDNIILNINIVINNNY